MWHFLLSCICKKIIIFAGANLLLYYFVHLDMYTSRKQTKCQSSRLGMNKTVITSKLVPPSRRINHMINNGSDAINSEVWSEERWGGWRSKYRFPMSMHSRLSCVPSSMHGGQLSRILSSLRGGQLARVLSSLRGGKLTCVLSSTCSYTHGSPISSTPSVSF